MNSEARPGKSKWATLLISLVLFVLGAALLRVYYIRPAEPYDEGLVLVGAWRVALGQIPYRDFWTIYSPGQFYVVALFFKLFGTTVESERWWDLLCRSALPVLGYLIAARVTPKQYALLVWAFILGWTASISYLGYPLYPALDFTLAALLCTIRFQSNRSSAALIAAGVCIGLATLFRDDFGAYAALGLMVTLGIFEFREGSIKDLVRKELYLVAGAVVIVLPVALYFLAEVPQQVLVDDLIVFPLTVFPRVRGLPMPGFQYPETAYVYFPFVALIGGLILGVIAWRRGPQTREYSFTLIGASLMGILLVNQARVRTDLVHCAPYLFVSVIVFGIIGWPNPLFGKQPAKSSMILSAVSGIVLLAMSWQPFWKAVQSASQFASEQGQGSNLARAPSIVVGPEILDVVKFLQEKTAPNEYIFVGDAQHDRIFWNAPLIYFLADRQCPTKYDELHPGSATTAPVQEQIVSDLKAHHVNWVVLQIDDHHEPNESSMTSGVHILDNYLHRNFQVVSTLQRHIICERK